MEQNMISIPVEEYKELLKAQVVMNLVREYVKKAGYISDSRIKEYLGIEDTEEMSNGNV